MKKALFALPIALLLASCSLITNNMATHEDPEASLSSDLTLSSGAGDVDTSFSSGNPAPEGEEDVGLDVEYSTFWEYGDDLKASLSMSRESAYAVSKYGAGYSQKYSDLYFPADLTLSSNLYEVVIHDVGVRMKGNLSRREFVNENGEIYQASHLKVSFKATFDDDEYDDFEDLRAFKRTWEDRDVRKARKNRRVAGMEKIDLKYIPRNDGNCLNGEMYVYDAFNHEGMAAPLSKPAELTMSTPYGSKTYSCQIVECVDEAFLYHHFGDMEDEQGTLYKCGWGDYQGNHKGANLNVWGAIEEVNGSFQAIEGGYIGEEDVYDFYDPCYDLKVGDTHERLVELILAAYDCSHGISSEDRLNAILDVDAFLKFEAMSYVFGNFDDQRNNYNNYYLYFRPEDAKAIYIAYDWDWAYGTGSRGAESYTPLRNQDLDGNQIQNPLYFATFLQGDGYCPSYSISSMQDTYLAYVDRYASTYLDKTAYASYLDEIDSSDRSDLDRVAGYFSTKLGVIEANS